MIAGNPMPAPCCPQSYAGSMRPCPRCGAWICHHCGVSSRGSMVCARCVDRPDPVVEAAPDLPVMSLLGNAVMFPAALGGGLTGGLFGGLAWAGASAVLGMQLGVLGILAGLGSRLGVMAAVRVRFGCAWPFAAGIATVPGFLLGRYLYAFMAARQGAPSGSVGFFSGPVWSHLWETLSRGFGLLEICWLGLAVAAATVNFGRR